MIITYYMPYQPACLSVCVFIQSKQRQLNDLYVGSQVIAKHKNGRYYHATITEVTRSKLYEVDFDDGSVSFDLLPEDIVVSMIAQVFHTVTLKLLGCCPLISECL